MKLTVIALTGLLALSTLAPAGEAVRESQDQATDAANAAFITPLAQTLLDQHYEGCRVIAIGTLKSFVVKGKTYQYAEVSIYYTDAGGVLTIYYVYDVLEHQHVFVSFQRLGEFCRGEHAGDQELLYGENLRHLFDGAENATSPSNPNLRKPTFR